MAVAVCLVLTTSNASSAEPVGREINPGVLGANALPPAETSGPWIEPSWSVSVGSAWQLSWPTAGTDVSATLPFRLEVPFVGRVAVWADGSPFELYRYSPETVKAWAPSHTDGGTRADVTIGMRVLITEGNHWLPAIGLRLLVKTATGEDLFNRRFIDAPAYQFDLLLGRRFELSMARLELALNVGFLAWQQGEAGQNDAFAASLRAKWVQGAFTAKLELRGYAGWEKNDTPFVMAVGGEWALGPGVSVWATLAQSFLDPVSTDLRAGLRFTGEAFEHLFDSKPRVEPPVLTPPDDEAGPRRRPRGRFPPRQ